MTKLYLFIFIIVYPFLLNTINKSSDEKFVKKHSFNQLENVDSIDFRISYVRTNPYDSFLVIKFCFEQNQKNKNSIYWDYRVFDLLADKKTHDTFLYVEFENGGYIYDNQQLGSDEGVLNLYLISPILFSEIDSANVLKHWVGYIQKIDLQKDSLYCFEQHLHRKIMQQNKLRLKYINKNDTLISNWIIIE